MKVALCVTVEPAETTVALVGRKNNVVVGTAAFRTRQYSYLEGIDRILTLAAHLEAESDSAIVAICMAVAGDVKGGVILDSSTLGSWIGQRPGSDLKGLNVPMAVESRLELDNLKKVATAAWQLA